MHGNPGKARATTVSVNERPWHGPRLTCSLPGDGFWSAGRTLEGDSVAGMSQLQPDFALPRETCGGAYRRRAGVKRTAGSRRPAKRRRRVPGATLTSGAQTGKTIKPGVGKQRLNRELPGTGGRVDGRDDLPKASAKDASYKDVRASPPNGSRPSIS